MRSPLDRDCISYLEIVDVSYNSMHSWSMFLLRNLEETQRESIHKILEVSYNVVAG